MSVYKPTSEPLALHIMSDLAHGSSLEEICRVRQLDLQRWQRVVKQELFQLELERMTRRIIEKRLQTSGDDPVIATLQREAQGSVDRLVTERDNFDPEEGASSNTRIRASEALLDRAGYGTKRDGADAPAGNIFISAEKVAFLNQRVQRATA